MESVTKRKRAVMPTDAEDAEINRGIAQDPDNPELTDEEFARMRPLTQRELASMKVMQGQMRERRLRGPQVAPTKESITIRLSPEVVEYFRATGSGWQTRMDGVLKGYVKRSAAAKGR